MKTTARVLLTLDCPRDCPYCVNKSANIMEQARIIKSFDVLAPYKEILISGGEPLLYPELINALLKVVTHQDLYLYTTLFSPYCEELYPRLAGIDFTVHEPDQRTVLSLGLWERTILKNQPKNNRLMLAPDMTTPVEITSACWSTIIVKTWRYGDGCIVPPHEDLFLYEA